MKKMVKKLLNKTNVISLELMLVIKKMSLNLSIIQQKSMVKLMLSLTVLEFSFLPLQFQQRKKLVHHKVY